jgi:ribosomal protein S18 acetylase RimI-like enzyme
MLSKFDWEAKARLIDGDGDTVAAAVLVTSRSTQQGAVAVVHIAGPSDLAFDLVRWGLQLSRAAGATAAHLFIGRGHGEAFRVLGLDLVRPWWRMDRSLTGDLPTAAPVDGYALLDGTKARRGTWEATFNRSFADHWRFSPRTEEELMAGKAPELCLMAVAEDGQPAAITHAQVEAYDGDARPQPVGLVSSVGTVPEQRRRGLAMWLVTEALCRLRDAGAVHASLYVDGWNHTHAYDAYRKLGFALAFEAEVWEATFP